MNAAANGAIRNGRAAAVRNYLRTQSEPRSARQIIEAVDPTAKITCMCATLSTLFTAGHVMREGIGAGKVHWRIAPEVATERAAMQRDAHRGAAMKAAAARHVAKREPGALTTPPKATKAPKKSPARVVSKAKPATSIKAGLRPPAAERESVDEFLRRGGHIEHLALGECSQPLRIYLEHRASKPAAASRMRVARASHG